MDYKHLKEVFENRHSTRAYTKVKPDKDVIREIISTARFAPNSCNLQHYGFIYIDEDETLKTLAKKATGKISWAPALIVAIDDGRFSRHRRAGLQSLAAAVENIFLAATAKGLGACWMAGFKNDNAIKKILRIPRHFEITGLIGIGYPDPSVPPEPTVRLAVDDYLHINGFENKNTELIESINVDDWPMEKLVGYRDRIGSVYAPRKRISLYHVDMIGEAASIFSSLAIQHGGKAGKNGGTLLDIASYDGCFVRALHKQGTEIDLSVSAADYSDYFLGLLRKEFPGTNTPVLSADHTLVQETESPFDFISVVFKAEFLPDPPKVFRNLKALTDSHGRLFVTSVTAGTPRAIWYRVHRTFKRANVYERNKLFHFGPYRHLPSAGLERDFSRSGWSIEKSGKAGSWPGKTFRWWWLAPS
jgi:nitroreductase